MVEMPDKPDKPTLYFVGVTTHESSINDVFPAWAEALDLNAQLVGINIEIHADPEDYRKVVKFIKENELAKGALVTTHKIDLFDAAKDMFDYLDPHCKMQEELSCISKRDNKLEGYAKDPISSGLAMEAFIPNNFWERHGGEVFIMGAGGSARAISSYLFDKDNRDKDNMPSKLVINNRSQPRLTKFKRIFNEINNEIDVEYNLSPEHKQNDEVLEKLKPYSLIVNATGLGKDRPGSPLSDNCKFPENSLVWELNYRGERKFMHQAIAQKEDKNLYIEDGWIYFIHGWSQVIFEVFDINYDQKLIDKLDKVAADIKNR